MKKQRCNQVSEDGSEMILREGAAVAPPLQPVAGIRYGEVSWERMIRAVEKVRERLRRAAAALDAAGVPYAVAGGNAVAAWVSRVDEAAVRNTQDVDILLRRADLPGAIQAMTRAGFVHRHSAGLEMFLDGPEAKARDAVHIVFASRKSVRIIQFRHRTLRNQNQAGHFACSHWSRWCA